LAQFRRGGGTICQVRTPVASLPGPAALPRVPGMRQRMSRLHITKSNHGKYHEMCVEAQRYTRRLRKPQMH